ncbi:ATP-NAD kinase-like domain-containing protein [Gongronella butleri]|nr:ATP-NAD kinase-like domain-containing protein [Gongronella butleri]
MTQEMDHLQDGRPSVYLFIFVNPLSGDRQGKDLLELPIQHFRLRQRPHIQVELHNILDEDDRIAGFDKILYVQSMVRTRQCPPLPCTSTAADNKALTRHIHIWSAGGDGTVMSVFEMMVQHKIDLDLVYFSCIPFGTGNDISQVLGWGRTTLHRDPLGPKLRHLETLLLDRLDHSEPARLDIWQVTISSHTSGYVRRAGPHGRTDGHDVMEVKQHQDEQHRLRRKMCSYMSIGVQGYVGSGFEEHRAGHRWANIWAYTVESAKWLFWHQFPPITSFVAGISKNNSQWLQCEPPPAPRSFLQRVMRPSTRWYNLKTRQKRALKKALRQQQQREQHRGIIPMLSKHPIDLVIQNIPHIWGRQVDLWGDARSGLEIVHDRAKNTPTDATQWHAQRANDRQVEIMAISTLFSYLKKLANFRHHVSRIGQFASSFTVNFWPPNARPTQAHRGRHERENIICVMCDGEFYEIKDPNSISFQWYAQIWTLGHLNGDNTGRIVRDELASHHETKTTK